MGVILYTKNMDASGERLQAIAESVAPGERIEVFRSIESLSERLLISNYACAVAILVTTNKQELKHFLLKMDILRKARLILILPDREPETIKIGYKLEPRFLSYIDSGFSEVRGVLQKML